MVCPFILVSVNSVIDIPESRVVSSQFCSLSESAEFTSPTVCIIKKSRMLFLTAVHGTPTVI